MTKVFTTILLLSLTILSATAQNVEKSLVKSFNLHGNHRILLDLPGPVELNTWSHSTIRVQMNVTLKNSNTGTLKTLVQYGRYNLRASQEEESLLISAPGLQQTVKIGEQELAEEVTFLVFAPENVEVNLANVASTVIELIGSPNSL